MDTICSKLEENNKKASSIEIFRTRTYIDAKQAHNVSNKRR